MRKCIKKTNRSHKPPIENIFIIITGILIIAIACTLYAFWIWNSDIRDTENQALNVVLAVEARIAVLSIIIIIFSFIALSKKNIDLRDEKRKLSETNKRLSEQEELFRTLYEQSPVGISFGN
ncbi:MAG TPA: hypothetical protein VN131_00820, partial [Mobilitalea sp.]|nr:hypothetical protein [Mobilitalea sp.]